MWALALGAGFLGLGVPVAICIGIAATIALTLNGTPLLVIPQQLFSNLNNVGLLAIPFFMLTGESWMRAASRAGSSTFRRRLSGLCAAASGR